jgi:hypothetical protein
MLLATTRGDAGGNVIRQLKLDDAAPVVDLFDGMESGQLDVKLIAKSANDANIFIKNTTAKPLTVSVPKAAIGVHILPQFQGQNPFGANQFGNQLGNNLGQALGNNPQNGGNQSQSIGGQVQPFGNQQQGFPNQGNNNQGFFGNGMFSIPPEKTAQLKMRTVCLDYGLPEPHLGLKYELRKLETAISNPVLRQLLEDYSPRVDQESMQAAAWHLSNGLTWKQVSNLPNPRMPLNVGSMFTTRTVKAAQTLVDQAETAAKERDTEPALPVAAPPAKLISAKTAAK